MGTAFKMIWYRPTRHSLVSPSPVSGSWRSNRAARPFRCRVTGSDEVMQPAAGYLRAVRLVRDSASMHCTPPHLARRLPAFHRGPLRLQDWLGMRTHVGSAKWTYSIVSSTRL
jgi:hypothetical protein